MLAKLFITLLLLCACCVAQGYTCAYCQYRPLTDLWRCVATCTSTGDGCGGSCCHTEEGGQVCWVGGCCSIVPGGGGVCYDASGSSCGAFACWLPAQGTTLLPQDSTVQRTSLKTVHWITNTDFPLKIGHYSKSFERALAALQLIINSGPDQTVKDHDSRKFYVTARPGFPVKVTVSHATGDQWVVYLDRADTEAEGVHAPILLEIVGNKWTLLSPWDENSKRKFVVGTGNVD